MAVPHFSATLVSRGQGRSAVMSAAYRHCARMEFWREASIVDYTRKTGLAHEAFVIPADAPGWIKALIANKSVSAASEAFWNTVESFEKRLDAQLARDVTIALPVELTTEQNIALVTEFVSNHVLSRGVVADWVYHDVPGNPHIHLMMTLRPLTETGFGSKKLAVLNGDGKPRRDETGKIVYRLWTGGREDFQALRDGWFAAQNWHLAHAGLDVVIDGRSYEKQGIELQPTIHLGPEAKAMERKLDAKDRSVSSQGERPQRVKRLEDSRQVNLARILRQPEIVIDLIIREKSVFDERDAARILHRYVDDPVTFQSLLARVMSAAMVLQLAPDRFSFKMGTRTPARYTSRALIRLEAEMVARTGWLYDRPSHAVPSGMLDVVARSHSNLSTEQRAAVEHVIKASGIAAVVGRAGAGKTTMMRVARQAWEAAGYRVLGGALAGKAAEGLEQEAGINSRTLASWELAWKNNRDCLDAGTIFVLDEAGMVASNQMSRFVDTVVKAGAKIVLIGDPDQLQPIEAGAAFRAITDRIGYAELGTIYRQREAWMREASLSLARGRADLALEAYRDKGRLFGLSHKADAAAKLIADWIIDYDPAKTTLILAHLRRDVSMLNTMARAKLVEKGHVSVGHLFETQDGPRRFSPGDQIVFLKNDSRLGVKNGMLGKVVEAADHRISAVVGDGQHRRMVTVDARGYDNLDHGYATTIHKSQGTTVDRVLLLASLSLDRHLTYVAMTRQREDLSVYYGSRSFQKAGGLAKILSRSNPKETTLDYENEMSYPAALRFAYSRGLNLMEFARAVLVDRLRRISAQRATLGELAARLSAVGERLGLVPRTSMQIDDSDAKLKKTNISAITVFALTFEQAVEQRLAGDPGLKAQWQEVSSRFGFVFARPEDAFRAVDLQTMLEKPDRAAATLARLSKEPQSFCALNGNAGIARGRVARASRRQALANVPLLVSALEQYISQRADAERRYHRDEQMLRERLSIAIPALSPTAREALAQVLVAADCGKAPALSAMPLIGEATRRELEDFVTLVAARFGERSFLPDLARSTEGPVFQRLSHGMTLHQSGELKDAWPYLRAAQFHAAYLRKEILASREQNLKKTAANGLKFS